MYFIRLILATMLLVLAAGGLATPTQAHAVLTASEPMDGAVLGSAPAQLNLSFNEAVTPLSAALLRPDGSAVDLQLPTMGGSSVIFSFPQNLGNGSHAVSWRAVSDDGHPVSGVTFFSIGAPTSALVAKTGEVPEVMALLWAARLTLFVALFFGVGGSAFRILSPQLPPVAVRVSSVLIVMGAGAAVLIVGLQGLDALGEGLPGLLQPHTWATGFSTAYGLTSAVALLALVLGYVSLHLAVGPILLAVSAVAIAAAGLAVTLSGHASAAEPQWLTKTAVFVHMTCIGWWLGALFPLIVLLRHDAKTSTPPLLSFSRAIPYAIMALVASGMVLAVIQLGQPGPAWWTPYGFVLAAKLVLLAVLFAIASWNRWVLTTPAAAGEAWAMQHMRRGIAAEIVIILAVLGLVSMWRFTPPPRALADAIPPSAAVELTDGSISASLLIRPARVGPATATVDIRTIEGSPIAAKAVKIVLEQPGSDLAAISRPAEKTLDGQWSTDRLVVPVAGSWLVSVEVRVSDFKLVRLEGQLIIAP